MKICIKDEGKRFTLVIPTALLTTKVGFRIAMKSAGNEIDETRLAEQRSQLREALKVCRKNFGHMELLHIESEDGSGLSITL